MFSRKQVIFVSFSEMLNYQYDINYSEVVQQ